MLILFIMRKRTFCPLLRSVSSKPVKSLCHALIRVSHSGVRIQPPEACYIVMELCSGGDLEQWLFKDMTTGRK